MVTWPVCPGEEPIAAYAAGRLPRLERDAIDAHLDTCRACSELVAELAKLASSRDASEPVPLGYNPASTIGGAGEVVDDRWFDGHLGRYVLIARIGAGGLGIVYSAYDPELDRRVALKILRAGTGDALRGEARAIAKLAHPNVVAVHDVGHVDDAAFVAMEYVDGVTLREWLSSSRTPRQILDVFIQAGRGIAAAHAAGLVHRDIKPTNIMIGGDGRARVLDFGLASAANDPLIGGTPAYMAPEQARGEAVDARADQYAFCVALWEGLAGERPSGERTLPYVAEPVVRALRRGLSPDPAARFPSFDALLAELVPPPSRRHLPWLISAIVALCAAIGWVLVIPEHAPSCGEPVTKIWGANERSAVRTAFAVTKLPFANATTLIAQLDDWSARWKLGAEATCRQPAQVLRQNCLAGLLDQLRPIVTLATHADANVVERADVLVPSLPAPERCDRVVGDIAPPGERVRGEVEALRRTLAELEAQLIAGREIDIAAIRARADATGYAPLRARAMFLGARLDNARTRFTLAITKLHATAQLATAARDQELLAETWIELVKSLGNDPRDADAADLFDGYVAALIPELPDHAQLAEQLAHARCTRNVTGAAAVETAMKSCAAAIPHADPASANAERVRLGHFQRMLGKTAESLATLKAAVAEAERVFGATHPDTAIAHYALGIAEISSDQVDAGLVELRTALAIRRAAFPEGGPAVAESLQGLGDALGTAGRHAEAVPVLEEGLAMLDRVHQGESAEAANMQLLVGMSLEELHRTDDAIAHDLRGADIADRSLEHREELAAMGLRMAANLEPPAAGLAHAERALRLLERGHGSLAALGKTQLLIAEKTGDRARARAMAITARANLVAAGAAGAEDLPEAEAFLKTH